MGYKIIYRFIRLYKILKKFYIRKKRMANNFLYQYEKIIGYIGLFLSICGALFTAFLWHHTDYNEFIKLLPLYIGFGIYPFSLFSAFFPRKENEEDN